LIIHTSTEYERGHYDPNGLFLSDTCHFFLIRALRSQSSKICVGLPSTFTSLEEIVSLLKFGILARNAGKQQIDSASLTSFAFGVDQHDDDYTRVNESKLYNNLKAP
jgi:hypothetical protein